MSCFASRFALFSSAVRGPFKTSGNLRGGMVDKKLKAETFKIWTLSLTGTRCPRHLTQGN